MPKTATPRRSVPARQWVLDNLVLAVLYFGTARLGQLLTISDVNVTPVWIPSGIILAAAILRGWHVWPGIFVGAVAGTVGTHFDGSTTSTIVASMLCCVAHGLGDVLCVQLSLLPMRSQIGCRRIFQGTANVLRFIGYCAILGPGVSALISVTALCSAGIVPWDMYGGTIFWQWTGNGFGVLIFTPAIVTWACREKTLSKPIETCAFVLALAITSTIGLDLVPLQSPIRVGVIAVIPILMWGVFRLNQYVCCTAISMVAIAAVCATIRDYDPFSLNSMILKLNELQLFLAISTVTLLVLSGVISDRKRVEAALRDSEERFSLAVRGTNVGIFDWDIGKNSVYLSPRWKSMLGYEDHEVQDSFSEWEDRLHPDDRQRALQTLRDYLDGKTEEFDLEHRLQHKDGSYRWILARGMSVCDQKGKPYRMVGSHLDITDRVESEGARRAHEAQLIAAQRIQERLLPQGPPELPGYDIFGDSFPAEFAAGDHFDFLRMSDGSLGVVIGDVSGHGFSSALLMASTCAHLRSLTEMALGIGEIFTRTNAVLAKETEQGHFVSLLLARIDPNSNSLMYVNAGHPAGCVMDRQANVKAQLTSLSVPLGVLPVSAFPVGGPISLEPGETLLMVTDGVLEARAPNGEFFEMNNALAVVRANYSRSASEIVEAIHEAVCHFAQNDALEDDVTIVVVKHLGD